MLEVEYKVVSLEQLYGQIKVVLIEIQEPVKIEAQHGFAVGMSSEPYPVTLPISPSPFFEEEPLVVEPPNIKLEPIPKTDSERVMSEMIDAVEKFAPGFKDAFKSSKRLGGMYIPPSKPQSYISLILSDEQYEELGSPQFQSVMKLRMEIG